VRRRTLAKRESQGNEPKDWVSKTRPGGGRKSANRLLRGGENYGAALNMGLIPELAKKKNRKKAVFRDYDGENKTRLFGVLPS